MGNTMSRRRSYSFCVGYGICVALKHGLIIVSDCKTKQLHMHLLADGSLVRSVGSEGCGKEQFNFGYGGLCVSLDGDSVLVAERDNHRVQEVRTVDGSWVRFVGEGVLVQPQCVDCDADVIVVSEVGLDRISVLSWADGSVRARFGSWGSGPGQLNSPAGVRLLADGSGLVVADCTNHRLCLFTLSGEFVAAIGSREQGVQYTYDVLECASDGSFILANYLGPGSHNLIKVGRDGVKVGMFGQNGGDGEFYQPTALAALPDGGFLVRGCNGVRCSIFRDQRHRLEWIGACVSAALV
jgi:hypothetical protein